MSHHMSLGRLIKANPNTTKMLMAALQSITFGLSNLHLIHMDELTGVNDPFLAPPDNVRPVALPDSWWKIASMAFTGG